MAKYKLGLGQFFDARHRLHKEGDLFSLPNDQKPPRYAIPVDADARKTVRAIIKAEFLPVLTGPKRGMDDGEKSRRDYEDLCRRYWLRDNARSDNEETADEDDDGEGSGGDDDGDEADAPDEEADDQMTMREARGQLEGGAGAGAKKPAAKKPNKQRAADKAV